MRQLRAVAACRADATPDESPSSNRRRGAVVHRTPKASGRWLSGSNFFLAERPRGGRPDSAARTAPDTAGIDTRVHLPPVGLLRNDRYPTPQILIVGFSPNSQAAPFRDSRNDAVIATKFGTIRHTAGDAMGLDGSPENVRLSVEGSLKRLGTDYIDLYYQHRMILPCRSRTRWAHSPNWWRKARSGTSACQRPPRTPSAGRSRPPCNGTADRILAVEQGSGT